MNQNERICPQCGQMFCDKPAKCTHCGYRFSRYADKGRVTDLIPVFRMLPYRLRKVVLWGAALVALAYWVDLVHQLDELHRFMGRKGLPAWARR